MGYIVNVFDKNQVGIQLIQIIKKGAMTGRPENKPVTIVAKGSVSQVNGKSVRRWLLNRKINLKAGSMLLPILVDDASGMSDNGFLKFLRDGKMQPTNVTARTRVTGCLDKMLLQSGSAFIGILMKNKERLRQIPVIQSVSPKYKSHDFLNLTLSEISIQVDLSGPEYLLQICPERICMDRFRKTVQGLLDFRR